ncbi:restriction endonuclease subunit S [Escherichia coli]|uniref:restriction endonuclease subunit S n=2 Tax=Escherichia coli TaxID=562 RepID=UPI000B4940AF|nr:restriction endonuclease subunit S [Escherichia coli]EFO2220778.1 restriction endonuclease subunit S [Escherichia coli O11]EEU1438898.1 restriction endonuclease subunit S [Escherichia coli]EFF1358742.1 restriction endonuclease subunit S [Escherichia coli]EFI4200797.1 restriction endonuclease subunit S [Escherichia coli]EFI4248308.1 restriction endonuclease subunit S [Escherichia coli]
MTEQQLLEGWQMVKFGDIAKHISKRVEPSETALEIYVGLEHLDPNSLKIKRHGTPSDVEGQKLLVKKGQIIFGKRRAYQRKVAVADWDCICSAHAMVLEANSAKVIPDFLPFFMQSDIFMNRAVAVSEGSLSPTIKWKVLAEQKFLIPGLEKQRYLVRLYKTVTGVEEKARSLFRSTERLYTILRESLISGLNTKPKVYLGDLGYTFSGLQGKNATHFNDDGNAKYITYMGVFSKPIIDCGDFARVIISSDEEQNKVKVGDVFFTISSETPQEVGMSSVLLSDVEEVDLYLNSFCVGFRPNTDKILPRFLVHYLRSDFFRMNLRKLAQGITRYNISRKELMKCPFMLASIEEQSFIADALDEAYRCLINAKDRANKNSSLKNRIISDSLRG